MSKLIPDLVFDSIYDISPTLLWDKGIRGVLMDLDGTMASRKAVRPPETLAPFVHAMQDAGLRVLVFSNNREKRVGPFCRALGTAYICRAGKPFIAGFRRAARLLALPVSQLAIVGDQIFTDVYGGNRAGALTCYVETLDRRHLLIRARYRLERGFIRRGRRRMEAGRRHE